MSRRFGIIDADFWRSRKLRGASPLTRLVYIYLVTNRHGNSAGIYHLPLSYLITDMGFERAALLESMKDLIDRRTIEYDKHFDLIRIVGWFDHAPNRIDNPKHGAAVVGQLADMRCDSDVFRSHVAALAAYIAAANKPYLHGLDLSPLGVKQHGDSLRKLSSSNDLDEHDTGIDTGIDTGTETRRRIRKPKQKQKQDSSLAATACEPASARKSARPAVHDLISDFREWYQLYPKKKAPKYAEAAYIRARRAGRTKEQLLTGLQGWLRTWERNGTSKQYIPEPASWLNAGREQDDLSEDAARKADVRFSPETMALPG